jgi:hypothetical protein
MAYKKDKLFALYEISSSPVYVCAAESREDAEHHARRVWRQFGNNAEFVVVGGTMSSVAREA